MVKIYYQALLFFFLSLQYVLSGYTEGEKQLKEHNDDPMDIFTSSEPVKKKQKREKWKTRINHSATESVDSESGRSRAPGTRFYHHGMTIHNQRKSAFLNGMVKYAPPGREERLFKKFKREKKSSLRLEKKHERWSRGIRNDRYDSGKRGDSYVPKNPPLDPPKNTEEVMKYLDNPHVRFNTDKRGPKYLLPEDLGNVKRRRRFGEPRNSEMKPLGETETESESEPEYRRKYLRKMRNKRKNKSSNSNQQMGNLIDL